MNLPAQQGRIKIAGKIYYNVSHLVDTLSGRWINEVCILYYGQGGALFRSYDAMNGIAAFKKWRENGSVGPNPGFGKGSRDLYYTYSAIKQVQRVREFSSGGNLGNRMNYVMPESIEIIQWKIVDETKKIGDYTCQKASGSCRGRDYIVWFCNDIPFSFGPWKLSGLPGLIMEAGDTRNQVFFRYNRIEKEIGEGEYIEPVTNFILTKEADFEKMREAYYNVPEGNGITGTITNSQGKVVQTKIPIINNPIDKISKLPTLIY